MKRYQSCETDQELFEALVPHLDDLLMFFQLACTNQAWARKHPKFFCFVLRWAAKQFYLGHLPLDAARRLVKIVQAHYTLLEPFLYFRAALFFTLRLHLDKETVLINSFLFGVCSPILREIFQRECFNKIKDEWAFPHLSLPVFRQLEAYILRGALPEVEKCEHFEVVSLLNQAKAWELHELVDFLET